MAENSKIEWTDHTFNPWEGCQKVGPGCDHCYAETRNSRFGGGTAPNWGPGAPRRRTSAANWKKPGDWNKTRFFACAECSTACTWRGECDGESCPSCGGHVVPARPRVFCASLADWLDNEAPIEWLVDLLDLIRLTPGLDWLLLSKRIGNWRKRLSEAKQHVDGTAHATRDLWLWIKAWLDGEAPANVWLGATVVNQEEADRDIPKLLAVPARVRFLSMEPLLGLLDLERVYLALPHACWIDWVIVGGESGPGARPMHPDWARSLRNQCAAAGVPFLFKQWGEYSTHEVGQDGEITPPMSMNLKGMRVFVEGAGFAIPSPRATVADIFKRHAVLALPVGKKEAGRLLDGVEHNGFPAS